VRMFFGGRGRGYGKHTANHSPFLAHISLQAAPFFSPP
jgi:hypothetical protein